MAQPRFYGSKASKQSPHMVYNWSMSETKNIQWCPNCVHFYRVRSYENSLNLSKEMISDEYIPCKIFSKTRPTWERHFSSEGVNRYLFPKDCPVFEQSEKPHKIGPHPLQVLIGLVVMIALFAGAIFILRGFDWLESKMAYHGFVLDVRFLVFILLMVGSGVSAIISRKRK